ncbi:hypothetical protein ACEPAF_1111 [Sanghuangporus sanghuang]
MSLSQAPEQPEEGWTVYRSKNAIKKLLIEQCTTAERIITACDDNLFLVLPTLALPRDERTRINEILSASAVHSNYSNAHHRLMPVLDALASLSVSQGRGETVAVGLVPPVETPSGRDDKLLLFIGANGSSKERLSRAKRHLEAIFGHLRNLRIMQEITPGYRRESTPDETDIVVHPTLELYRLCYTFSKERLRRYFDKAKEFGLDSMLRNFLQKKKNLKPNPGDHTESSPGDHTESSPGVPFPSASGTSTSILRLEDTQWDFVSAIVNVFDRYDEHMKHVPGKGATAVLKACSDANDLARRLGNLEFLDEIPGSEFLSSPICLKAVSQFCSLVLAGKSEDQGSCRDEDSRYSRLVEKLLSIDSSIRQLLILCKSASCGHILDNLDLDVQIIPPQQRLLHYDLNKDNNIKTLFELNRDLGMTFDDFKTKRTASGQPLVLHKHIFVHAEAVVLQYFLDHRITAYPYIGVSRLSCVGCWLFFKAMRQALGQQHYYTRGSHSRAYQWVFPSLDLAKVCNQFMATEAKDFFDHLGRRGRQRPRTFSESTAASVSDHGVTMPWSEAMEDECVIFIFYRDISADFISLSDFMLV